MSTTAETHTNPLIEWTGVPAFDRIKPSHVVDAVTHMIAQMTAALEALEESAMPTWAGVAEPLQAITLPMERIWGPVGHLLAVRNSEALREAHTKVLPEVVAFGLQMQQSQPIYQALKGLRESDEWNTLTEAQQRVVTLRLRDAEHSGVGLQGADRERFNEIARELSQMATDFSNHVLDAIKAFELIVEDPADAAGWPKNLKQLAAQSYNAARDTTDATPDAGPWRITLDYPILRPFLQHCRNRALREQVFRAFMSRAAEGEFDNTPFLRRTLALRKEMASLLGFEHYAALSLDSKMAPDVAAVDRMYTELLDAARPHALKDREAIEQLSREMGQAEPVEHWDVQFYAERLRERTFDYTDDDVRPYFPLERALEGMFQLSSELFGIEIVRADGDAPVWHDDVRYFRVNDQETGEQIASFYLDPYSRPQEKRGGAWMDNCLVRRRLPDGSLQLPLIHLTCNGTPPVGDTPSLMSFDEVRTLFHEFGHGLQGMLTEMNEADVSGVSGVEWDAVEIASQFMENWLYHKPTLIGLTKHYETGEPLPDELFEKILAARYFMSGTAICRQVEFGMTDLRLHDTFDPADESQTPFDLHRGISEQVAPWPYFEGNRFLCAFSHIFAGGYAAGYYSYLWSEVLSADAFSAFEEAGLDDDASNASLGRKYRKTILACGGGREPMDVFTDFRGREPSTEALLRHSGLA